MRPLCETHTSPYLRTLHYTIDLIKLEGKKEIKVALGPLWMGKGFLWIVKNVEGAGSVWGALSTQP